MAIEKIADHIFTFPYIWIYLVLSVAEFLFEQYVNLRQYRKYLIKEMPPVLKTKLGFEEKEFEKSQNYSGEKLALSMLLSSLTVGFDYVLLVTFFSPMVWNKCGDVLKYSSTNIWSGFDPSSEFQRGLLFSAVEILRSKLVSIPTSLYQNFVLEEKHGFNKLTLRLFISDQIKGIVISCVLGVPILWGFLKVVEIGGDYFFFYVRNYRGGYKVQHIIKANILYKVEVFVLIVTIAMLWIYPNIIAPLFNKFEELPEGELRTEINKLADSINFPLSKIYTMDGSKRSDHSNAFFYGFGKNKRIVLFDTLLKHLEKEEILAVLCHELGHWKFGHMLKNVVLMMTKIFIIFYLFSFFRNSESLFLSFGYEDKSIFIGISLFFNIFSPISFLMTIFELKFSRMNEFQADRFACEMKQGRALSDGLIKLFKKNAGCLMPDSLFASLNYSHPTLLERADAIYALTDLQKDQGEKADLLKKEN